MNMAKKKDVAEKPMPVLPDLSKLTISLNAKAESSMPVDVLTKEFGISSPVQLCERYWFLWILIIGTFLPSIVLDQVQV